MRSMFGLRFPPEQWLIRPVQARCEDRNWPAILIEGRVGDVLVVQGTVKSPPDLEIVIGFENSLPSVGQGAVSGQNSKAAGRKEFAMNLRQSVENASEPEGIIRPPPRVSLNAHTQCGGSVDVAEHPGLSLAVAPTESGKNSHSFPEILVHVETKAIFEPVGAGQADVHV